MSSSRHVRTFAPCWTRSAWTAPPSSGTRVAGRSPSTPRSSCRTASSPWSASRPGVGGFDGGDDARGGGHRRRPTRRSTTAEPFDAVALTDFETGVWGDGPGQPAGRLRADARALLYEMNLPLNDPASVKGREIRLDPPATDRVADIRCPVLAVAGALDFSDVAATARNLEADGSERAGRRLGRRRAHDRDGAARPSRGSDRVLPRAARTLGLIRASPVDSQRNLRPAGQHHRCSLLRVETPEGHGSRRCLLPVVADRSALRRSAVRGLVA